MAQEIHLASGATEADIVKALANLGTEGGTIVLQHAETIAISAGLKIDVAHRNVTLDLNGSTLQQQGAVTVISGRGVHAAADKVSLGLDSHGDATISYAKLPADVAVGSWIKVISDNTIPGDMLEGGPAPTLMGQALQVASIQGNVVTFKGALVDQANYTTNVRAAGYLSGELVVKNGYVKGDTSLDKSTPPLVQIRELVDARLEHLSVHDGKGYGVSVVDAVNASLSDLTVKNMNDGATALGIGVQSMSSTSTTIKGYYAENVTHASDSNAVGVKPGSAYIAQFGADIGLHVSDAVAYNTRNFAYSWHSESANGTYDNVQAFDSFGLLTARGLGGKMTDSGGANNERGVFFYEWGNGDSRNISLDHITLKETGTYSTMAVKAPQDNTINNSFFESYSQGNLATEKNVKVSNSVYVHTGLSADDVIIGTAAHDLLLGGKGNDAIGGGGGDDYIWGGQGADILVGGEGRDRFVYHSAAEGGDTIVDFHAGPNADVIDLSVMAAKFGWADGDVVANGYARFLQSGADVLAQVDQDGAGKGGFVTVATLLDEDAGQFGAGNFHTDLWAPTLTEAPKQVQDSQVDFSYARQSQSNTLNGTDADNKLTGDEGSNQLFGNGGNDRLSGMGGDDLLAGGDGDDQLSGGAGNDLLSGGRGVDQLNGGAGTDTATYVTSEIGVTADLASNAKNAGGAAGDTFTSIENLTGSNFRDILSGNQSVNVLDGGKGDDVINGGGGADTLIGGEGQDWLNGGAGKDILKGGAGADSFYFATVAEAGDTVSDFKHGEDHIVLSASGFGIGSNHEFSFYAASQVYLYNGNALYAPSNAPTLIYNSDTGKLLFDGDGSGTAQKALFVATLTNAAQITFDDFLIV